MSSNETFKDLGNSSSEEDSARSDLTDGAAEEEKSSAAVLRHHPFSVDAIMSGRVASSRSGEHTWCKELPRTPLNPLYLCRETEGSRKSLTSSPTSPVKSEASESEECAPWVTNSAFPTQPRKFSHQNIFNTSRL